MKSSVRIESRPPVAIVQFSGTVGSDEADTFSESLRGALAEGATKFVVDLTGVDLLTSEGLRVLLELRHEAMRRGGFVRLVCADALIYGVFSTTKLDHVFPLYCTREEALQGL